MPEGSGSSFSLDSTNRAEFNFTVDAAGSYSQDMKRLYPGEQCDFELPNLQTGEDPEFLIITLRNNGPGTEQLTFRKEVSAVLLTGKGPFAANLARALLVEIFNLI